MLERQIRGYVSIHGALLIIFGIALFFLVSIILQRGYFLVREDQLFESLTAIFYLVAALFCFVGFFTARRLALSPTARYWLLGWAVILFVLAMEEASWGQRVVGLPTPGLFDAINQQNEINLHNVDSHRVNSIFTASVFVVGVALRSLALISKGFASFVMRRGIPLPPPALIVPFALAIAFVEPGWVGNAPSTMVLMVAGFAWFSYVLATRLRGRKERFPELHTLHLVMGVAGLVLIPVVLAVFEGNLGHESHPSEIKEFLFSVSFLIFSYRLTAAVAPSVVGKPRESAWRLGLGETRGGFEGVSTKGKGPGG